MRALAAALLLALLPLAAEATCPVVHRSQAVRREFRRQHPCPATHLTTGRCEGWVLDHIVPLCLGAEAGGIDAPSNLAWQTRQAAAAKDAQERAACHARWGGRR